MPLNLSELMKKAQAKEPSSVAPTTQQATRPWQQESVLFTSTEEARNISDKLKPNLSLTEVEVKSILSQTEVKPKSYKAETRVKVKTKPEPLPKPKLSQTEVKFEPNTTFTSFVGLQRNIVLFIYDECQIILNNETHPLSIEHIAIYCKSTKSSVRKAIQRLEQKGAIVRVSFKNGRGGWTRYRLPERIYNEINRTISKGKYEPNLSQTEVKPGTTLRTELKPETLSSSSSLNNKTTTTLPVEWAEINIEAYQVFGFGMTQLKQLASLNVISSQDVEDSLAQYKYDYDSGSLPRSANLNFLMGIMRKGGCYISEGYRTQEQQLVYLMKERADIKRKMLLEENLVTWEAMLNDTDKQTVIQAMPPHITIAYKAHGLNNQDAKRWLMDYYTSRVVSSIS
jgi:predicted transcriptional regulator